MQFSISRLLVDNRVQMWNRKLVMYKRCASVLLHAWQYKACIFTADIQMAGVESIWELHTVIKIANLRFVVRKEGVC